VKTAVSQATADEMFFAQLEEFCRLVQQEFLARFNEVREISTSTAHALAFAETLMLCPTEEAARACIRRELPAALSFVIAIQAMQRQLQKGHFKLPSEAPEYQTRFYLLAGTVRDFLQTLHLQLSPSGLM
jgi:hypothetical protein